MFFGRQDQCSPRTQDASVRLVYDGRLSPAVEAEGFFDAIIEAKSLLFS